MLFANSVADEIVQVGYQYAKKYISGKILAVHITVCKTLLIQTTAL